MDWLTFIVEITRALAWPLTIIIVATLLRKPLALLLPEMEYFKWKDFEIHFKKSIEEIKKKADLTLPKIEERDDHAILKLTELSPRTAIIESWQEVETALLEAASSHGIFADSRRSPWTFARALQEKGLLDNETWSIFSDLRVLRNNATHAPTSITITRSQAEEFEKLASRLSAKLRTL